MPRQARARREEHLAPLPAPPITVTRLLASTGRPFVPLRLLTLVPVFSFVAAVVCVAVAAGSGARLAAGEERRTPTVWKALAPLAGGPRQETAVVALGERVYVLGGFDGESRVVDTVEAYDPARDRWEARKPLPKPLHHANAAAVGDKLYVVGALAGNDFRAVGLSYEYDPRADRWTPKAPMPAGTERGASAVAAMGPRIYVAGGLRGNPVGDFSAYNVATNRWEVLPAVPGPRDHLVGGAVDGIFFAIGGRGPAVGLTGRVDAFDSNAKTWSSRRSMPTPRAGCAAGVVANRIIVVGGEGSPGRPDGVFVETEIYTPTTDSWVALQPMLTPRHGTGAAGLDRRLYVPGGAIRQGFGAVATNEVLEPRL
jgi:Kelch motif protein